MTVGLARLVLLCVAVLLQGCAAPPTTLDQNQRDVPGGRDAVVVLEQDEIRAEFVKAYGNGGYISEVIAESANARRSEQAERTVQPVRDSVRGYDFGRHAVDATRSALPRISWFDMKDVSFAKDGSKEKMGGILAQSAAPQLLVARYSYSMSPACDRIAVMLDVDMFAKGADKPENQIAPEKALYTQHFRYVRRLTGATRHAARNAAAWAADDGQAARAAFDAGLSMVNDLLIRSLTQSAEAAADLEQGRALSYGDEAGKVVETSAKGTLLYNAHGHTWTFIEGTMPLS